MAVNSISTKVGQPVVLPNISPIPVSYTPVIASFGTVTNNSATYKINTTTIRVIGTFIPGTSTGVTSTISLPNSYTAMNNSGATLVIGRWYRNTSTNGNTKGGDLFITNNSNTVNFGVDGVGNASSPFSALIGTGVAASGEAIAYDFSLDVNELVTSAYQAYGAGSVTGSRSGLSAPRTSMQTLAWTSAVFTSGTLRGYAYSDINGVWKLNFNGQFAAAASARTSGAVNITGITMPSYFQSISCRGEAGGAITSMNAYAGLTSGTLNFDHASAAGTFYLLSGDIELASKPTWA